MAIHGLLAAAVCLSVPLVSEADECQRRLAALQGSWKVVAARSRGAEMPDLRKHNIVLVFYGNALTSHDAVTKRGMVQLTPLAADSKATWAKNTKHLPAQQETLRPWSMNLGREWSPAIYQMRSNQLVLLFDHGLGEGELLILERQ